MVCSTPLSQDLLDSARGSYPSGYSKLPFDDNFESFLELSSPRLSDGEEAGMSCSKGDVTVKISINPSPLLLSVEPSSEFSFFVSFKVGGGGLRGGMGDPLAEGGDERSGRAALLGGRRGLEGGASGLEGGGGRDGGRGLGGGGF
uniref:Uncharacterized protein n=1 Tax=Lepeophtheirus salmonis TaxID=72036 RepID=A0A0K2U6H3_LEPSM